MPSKPLLIATALLTAACGTTGGSPTAQADVDPDVIGTWLATTGDPVGVIAVFKKTARSRGATTTPMAPTKPMGRR